MKFSKKILITVISAGLILPLSFSWKDFQISAKEAQAADCEVSADQTTMYCEETYNLSSYLGGLISEAITFPTSLKLETVSASAISGEYCYVSALYPYGVEQGDPVVTGASINIASEITYDCDWGYCFYCCVALACSEFDQWGGCIGEYACPSSENFVIIRYSGTRNNPDEPNLAPAYGAGGYPHWANVGVTTGSVNLDNPIQPILNWSTWNSSQEFWQAQVFYTDWSLVWESGIIESSVQAAQVSLSPDTAYYWRIAVCGVIGGQWCAWTDWAYGDSFVSAYTLTVSKSGSGSGTVTSDPAGIDCGSTCSAFYYDTSVVLSASASVDSSFAGWSGEGCSGTGTCTVSMTQSRNVTASFTLDNQAPSAINLSVVQPDYCVSSPAATLSWAFSDPDSGDTQSAYQVQIDNNSDFSSPEVNTGKVTSSSGSYSTTAGALVYNTTYYWRVMVWDNHDLASAWAGGASFSTPVHQYPTIDFSWAPTSPSAGEEVQFADQSTVYGGATKSAWLWTIPDANYVGGTDSFSQNPKVEFTSEGAKSIILQVTDSNGYVCQASKSVNALIPLPEWKEVAPQ